MCLSGIVVDAGVFHLVQWSFQLGNKNPYLGGQKNGFTARDTMALLFSYSVVFVPCFDTGHGLAVNTVSTFPLFLCLFFSSST